MCTGSVFGKMITYTLPVMFSGILQLLFNAADIIIVGKYSGQHHALAAVGSNAALINLLTNLFIGLSVGTNVVAAQLFGAKKEKDVSETVHTSMQLSFFSGILLTIVGLIGAPWFLKLMQVPKEVIGLSTVYLRIYFLGMTSLMVYNFGSAVLRAIGDTKRPLYFLTAAGVINVGLNLLFVIVFDMGVAGVGFATAISETVSAVLVIRCLKRERGCIRLDFRKLGISKNKLKKILVIGLPAGLQGTVFALSNVVIQSSVNSFGADAVSGNSAASSIEGFVYMAMNSFYQSTMSFTSQNYGAGQYGRIKRILICGEIYVILTGLLLGNAAVFFGQPLLSIYSDNPTVIQYGIVRLKWICTVYALCGIMDVLVGALRGIGHSLFPMFVSLMGACVLRLVWIATAFQIPKYHKLETVYVSYPITWTITLLVHLITFLVCYRSNIKTSQYHNTNLT